MRWKSGTDEGEGVLNYVVNQETSAVIIVQNPPEKEVYPYKAYNTSVCIQPDSCPGCGKCRLCDTKHAC